MSKRKKQEKQAAREKYERAKDRLFWSIIIAVSLFAGIASGYPLAAKGDIYQGILTGLMYGGGAFLALLASLFINRKLRGL